MKFNKYLMMCFLSSSLMLGSFTSCGDDETENEGSNTENNEGQSEDVKDKVENGKTTVEQGRADGKSFGENYMIVKGEGSTSEKVTPAINLLSDASKYKNSTDDIYKGAFAEAAVEVVYGQEEAGDNAVEQMNGLLDNVSKLESLKSMSATDLLLNAADIIDSFCGNKQ